jgi:hypothetical protein
MHIRINNDWADRPDRITFTEKVESDNATVAALGHNCEYEGVPDERANSLYRDFERREIRGHSVPCIDRPESFVGNAPAIVGIGLNRFSYDNFHRRSLLLAASYGNAGILPCDALTASSAYRVMRGLDPRIHVVLPMPQAACVAGFSPAMAMRLTIFLIAE